MINNRIKKLREKMEVIGIDCFYVPGIDPHASEYLPDFWKRREWISGFTGSAGDVMITLDKSGLWTDSRYFIQAEKELENSEIKLFKCREPQTPDIFDWAASNVGKKRKIGIDPQLISINTFKGLEKYFKAKNVEILLLKKNPIDEIWEERCDFPNSKAEDYKEEFAGESRTSKINKLQEILKLSGFDSIVLTALDDIAWLFNIRGKDIEFNPVLISYALISLDKAILFIKTNKVDKELKKILEKDIILKDYDNFENYFQNNNILGNNCLMDFDVASKWVFDIVPSKTKIEDISDPVADLKAIKNNIELKGMKKAHIKDGVALVKFLYWCDKNLEKNNFDEYGVAEKLMMFRKEQENYRGLSFETISAFKENGAIVHYAPSKSQSKKIEGNGLLLLDSGAQFLEGTTDITRTLAVGEPTEEEKLMFTKVLQGHIDLFLAQFPQGTCGKQLDTIARKPLWDMELNYGHGTGHGVGVYLNVHEAPPSISYYRCNGEELKEGMITSNEPGYYKEGEYGIRIENLIYVDKARNYDNTGFLCFKNLTMCPYDKKLIVPELLNENQKKYINEYHQEVWDKLNKYLNEEEKEWLRKATSAI